MGNHEQSVTMGEAALRAHRTASDRRGHQHTLVVLGASAIENGRLGDAERYLSAAAEMTGAAAAEEHTLMLLTNMGILAHVRGRTRAAVASFLKSLAIATRLRIPAAVAQAHHNLGLALRELGHTQEADEHVTQAILFATIARNAALIATTLLGRAEMKIAQRRFQEARIDIKEALERASSAGDEIGVAEAYRLLAVLGVRSSDFGAAVDPAREGRRIAIRRGSRVLAAECRAIEAEALRGAGEGIQASGAHAEALTELTSLGAENAARLAQRWWRMGLPAPGVEKAIDVPA
jgi:tetratricopeptide (TPR) repeat protein